MEFIILAAALVCSLPLILLTKKKIIKRVDLVLLILSIVFAIAYIPRLLSTDVFDEAVKLNGIFNESKMILLTIFRWLSYAATLLTISTPLYRKIKTMNYLLLFFVIPIQILNIIFFKTDITCFLGTSDFGLSNYRVWTYIIELSIAFIIYAYVLVCQWERFDLHFNKKLIVPSILAFIGVVILMMPNPTLNILFGPGDTRVEDFTYIHRIYIYIGFIAPIIIYILLHKKSYEIKNCAYGLLCFGGFMQFFYELSFPIPYGLLPVHICNAAMIILPIAFLTKNDGLYFFTYFVNVLGAICAMIMPNTVDLMFNPTTLRFWYNHWFAFFVPMLGIPFGLFKRPDFKAFKKGVLIFSIYIVIALAANMIVTNFDRGIDYFFLNTSYLADQVGFGGGLRKYVYTYQVGDLFLTWWPVYQLAIYLVFVALMFAMWYIYEALFKVAGQHLELHNKKVAAKIDLLKLKEDMGGRPITEPIDLEGTNMIKIEHFTKVYGNGKTPSVDDFSLEIHDGEVFGFVGHNGAGKSTTIKSLVGIQSITQGKIEICGYDIAKQPMQAKLNIGYVPDNHAVYEKLTGREYVNYVADLYLVSKKDRDERLEHYLELFGLKHAIDMQIKSYSHGMKQKLTVIAALIHDPKVWVLDEPLTGLDPTSSIQLKDCMREHANKGNIVFFSSHIIEVVEKICDRIAIIRKGKLQGVFSIKELKEQGISLEELYLKYVKTEDEH